MIQSSGPSNAKIFFVGDYPSQAEITENVAFRGASGSQLGPLLQEHGLKLDDCFKTLIIREESDELLLLRSRNKTRRTAGYKHFQINKYEHQLVQELIAMKPKVIVPVGELALRHITGEHGIHDFRGSILPLHPNLVAKTNLEKCYVVPLVHPREYFADNAQRFIGAFDLGKIVRLSTTPFYNPLDKYKVWVCRSVADFRAFIQRYRAAKYWTFDIETHNSFITCISFCGGPTEAISVPLLDPKIPIAEQGLLYWEVAKFLANGYPKVNQNIKFDWTFLEAWSYTVNNVMDDTMLLAHTLYSELTKNLGFLTSVHTDIPYYKDEGKEFDPRKHSKDQLYLYNAKDALATWLVYESLVKDAKEMKLWDFHCRGPQKYLHIYKKIDQRGFLVDDETRKKKCHRYETILAETEYLLHDLTGNNKFNPQSPKQCVELVYGELKCPPQFRKNEDGKNVLTTDEDAIEELILNHADAIGLVAVQILQGMLKSRKINRVLTFLNAIIDIDGRVRQQTKITGTENGRTSASKSIFYRNVATKNARIDRVKTGYSFQTIPKHGFKLPSGEVLGDDLIEIFVPGPGRVFLGGDLSQAEARVVAVLAKDWNLLTLFDTADVHKITASWIYKCQPEDIKKPSFERDIGKMARHAGNLDMQPPTLSLQAHIPIKEAKTVLTNFHIASPNVQGVFHKEIRDAVSSTRTLNSPQGRQRFFFDRFDDNLFRQAYSFIPQSSITDQMKDIMIGISEEMLAKGKEPNFIYENHDGIMADQLIEDAELFMDLFIKYAAKAINFRNCTLARDIEIVVPAELEFSSTCWNHKMKDWKDWGK